MLLKQASVTRPETTVPQDPSACRKKVATKNAGRFGGPSKPQGSQYLEVEEHRGLFEKRTARIADACNDEPHA
jgi:hypothetical protein